MNLNRFCDLRVFCSNSHGILKKRILIFAEKTLRKMIDIENTLCLSHVGEHSRPYGKARHVPRPCVQREKRQRHDIPERSLPDSAARSRAGAFRTRLTTLTAAFVQLSVPVLTAFGAYLFLGEDMSLRLLISGCIILFGIAYHHSLRG